MLGTTFGIDPRALLRWENEGGACSAALVDPADRVALAARAVAPESPRAPCRALVELILRSSIGRCSHASARHSSSVAWYDPDPSALPRAFTARR